MSFDAASALCYLPLNGVNIILALALLAIEPPEHTRVRFHAKQSLWLIVSVMGVMLLAFAVMFGGFLLVPLGAAFDESLAVVGLIVAWVLGMVAAAVVQLVGIGTLLVYLWAGVRCWQGKQPRIPVISGWCGPD